MESMVVTSKQTSQVDTDWGSMTWLANANIGNATGMTVGRVVIKPGCSNPRHTHSNCEEALYLLSGKLEHTYGSKRAVLEPGDTITIPAGVPHNATSIGAVDADMIVVYDSAERKFEKE